MMNAISLVDLSKTYRQGQFKPQARAIENVSLDVSEGETFGFIGPNGAGKSTTIKIMTGAISNFQGQASLFGLPVSDPQARFRVGYVPENPYLNEFLTPYEVLHMGVRLHRLEIGNIRSHCMNWLERFGIARVADKKIRNFSKGMTQRVALAHALAIEPRLLILDEPLSGLDPLGRRDVVDILSDYKRCGGTLFFTSHVLHDVERLADRFGLIHKGRLTSVQSPAEFAGAEEQVEVRSLGVNPVIGMLEEFSGRWVCTIPRSRLWQTLSSIELAGHVLVEVKPSLSLERAFMAHVRPESSPK